MTLASNYSYQPLSQPRFIRLLTLSPSPSPSKPIRCHLRQASLDDASKTYEALSYTWGARNGTVPISCDGQTLLVTPNCESALRHLRNRLTSRVLWVDAVCIDQGSAEEKSTQVPLMGDIYALASQVVVWLGQGVPEDEALLRRARIGGRLCYVRGVPDNETLFSPRTRKWVSKAMSEFGRLYRHGIYTLCIRPTDRLTD
jgi:hypothetical protein